MSFISESQLSEYRSSTKLFSSEDFVNLSESHLKDKAKPMVFLSHKHDEIKILQDVIAFLKKEGVEVYVDWMDESMPSYTSAKTAKKLKVKIKTSSKFILIATTKAINSKWCNWELGLGDAEKYIKDIALLPVIKSNQSYTGFEYLKIYPYIEFENGRNKYINGSIISKGYYVKTPLDNGRLRLTPLKKWLKN